jgi:hypothetical protein
MDQCYDSPAAMDTRDSPAWITRCEGHTDQSYNSLPAMYHSLSNRQEMNPDASHTGHSTSLSHSISVPEIGQQGQPSLHSPTEKFCPLLADERFEYTPELGYLDFTSLPEIENYTSVPLYYSEGPITLTLHRRLRQLTHNRRYYTSALISISIQEASQNTARTIAPYEFRLCKCQVALEESPRACGEALP